MKIITTEENHTFLSHLNNNLMSSRNGLAQQTMHFSEKACSNDDDYERFSSKVKSTLITFYSHPATVSILTGQEKDPSVTKTTAELQAKSSLKIKKGRRKTRRKCTETERIAQFCFNLQNFTKILSTFWACSLL